MASGSPQRHRNSQDSQFRYEPDPYLDDRSRHSSTHNSHNLSNDGAGYKAYTTGPAQSNAVHTKPMSERVDAAVHQTPATQDFSPDLVAQITEQVLNSLKKNGIGSVQNHSDSHRQDSSMSPAASVNSFSQRNTDTSNLSDGIASSNRDDSHNYHHQYVDGPSERDSTSRRHADSIEAASTIPKARGQSQRPPPMPRISTDDATTLEKIWQPLFSSDGSPLPRLGEFLRGLALHIIEDYEPKNSLVISPSKMLRFYEEVKMQNEIYPWKTIFGGKVKNSSLSHIYRDLLCEHHFVQPQRDDKPSIPALTPLGFQTWMTSMIQAHPEHEYERFSRAVLNMPISNADNRKERFPKELSRRLFPKNADADIQWDIEDILLQYEEIEFMPTASTSSSSQDHLKHNSSSYIATDRDKDKERGQERQYEAPTYMPQPSPLHQPPPRTSTRSMPPPLDHKARLQRESSLTDEEDDGIPSKPIERERKPYRAQPGGGKVYEGFDDNDLRRVRSEMPRSPTVTSAMSAVEGGVHRPSVDGQDDYADRASRPRTESQPYLPTPSSQRRTGSPPKHTSPYTRSEGDMAASSTAYRPSNYLPDNSIDERLHPADGGPRRFVDEESARGHPSQQQHPFPLPQQQQQQQSGNRTNSIDEGHRRRAGTTSSSSTGGKSVGSGGQGYYYVNAPSQSNLASQTHSFPPPPPPPPPPSATTYSHN